MSINLTPGNGPGSPVATAHPDHQPIVPTGDALTAAVTAGGIPAPSPVRRLCPLCSGSHDGPIDHNAVSLA